MTKPTCACLAVLTCMTLVTVAPAVAQQNVPPAGSTATTVPPPAAPPVAVNPGTGSLRRQNRRQFMYQEDQRNDAEEAIEQRGQNRANAAEQRGNAAQDRANAAKNRGSAAQNRGTAAPRGSGRR